MFGGVLASHAQDLHFSQFFSNPIALNPANAGRYNEDWRVTGIHRTQWKALSSTFNTSSFGFDMNLKEGFLKKDKIGFGLLILRDELGQGRFDVMSVSVPLAYHHTLDIHRRHHISIGANFEFVQKRINGSDLQFGNQYVDYEFDESLASNELLPGDAIRNFNLSAGLIYGFTINALTKIDAGASLFQLTTPSEAVIELPDSTDAHELGMRSAITLGGERLINEKLSVHPRILYMTQSKGRDFNIGAYVQYKVGENLETKIMGGAWYRVQDAAVWFIGAGFKQYEVGFSYDMTTSGLSNLKGIEGTAGGSVGAWELSFKIMGLLDRAVPGKYTVPCGIF